MAALPRRAGSLVVVAAIGIGAAAALGFAGWPQPHRTLEFSGLILAAVLASALGLAVPPAMGWTIVPPSFVVEFTSLLLLGPNATMLVVSAGALAQNVEDESRARRVLRLISNLAMSAVAISAAGSAHWLLGGTVGGFKWPVQALPIAAAVLVYCLVRSALVEIVAPLCMRQPIDRTWPASLVEGGPNHLIAATLAVVVAEVINHRAWEIAAAAALPLVFAYRAYCALIQRLEEEQHRRRVVDSLEEGMAAVDGAGLITMWTDAVARILDIPRDRALGRSLALAIPSLAKTALPRAITESLADRSPRTLEQIALPSTGGSRTLQVRIVPIVGGVTLLWQDVTERTRVEQALKRNEERLALAAEGANDGLWEWDLRTQECFFSSRWKALVGLPATAELGRADDWMNRVHAEDAAAFKEALNAHLAGQTDHLHHEHRIRHEDGSYRRVLCRGIAVRGTGRRFVRIAGSLTDTTERAAVQEQIRSAGFLDPLTGLCNRGVFVEGLGRRLAEFKEWPGGLRFAVLYLDLDRFKIVNDSLGHLVGDELLISVSRRLETCLRPDDTLARLGGDEFSILLNGLNDEQQANAIAFRIQETLRAPFSIGGREVFSSASIGIAFSHATYTNPDEIMRDADAAMYHAKARGKARHELFDADMHARALGRLGLENDLRHAVNHNAFEVHYQPIVSLASGMCVGFESLVRWTRNGEAVSPATFVPMAEELGLIEPLGTWVLQQACSTFADWQRRFPSAGLDCITVNVSGRQLAQQNFLGLVEQAVQKSGLKPRDLRLEITETALMDSPAMAAELLRELRDFGVKIYLDDFGTGYSSLSHLHKLPVDALKIDRSFVRSLLLPDRPAIVESILALARTLNTSVVAEGIESDVQATELERLGCTHAQGFLFSRPICAAAVEEILVANRPLNPMKAGDKKSPAAEPKQPAARIEWPEHLPVRTPEFTEALRRAPQLA